MTAAPRPSRESPARPGQPLWVRAIHRLERAIGEPLESVLHSDPYFDTVSDLLRLRRGYGRAAEGVSRRLLHLVNIPAGTDIRRVREQLARVERELSHLAKELERPVGENARPGTALAPDDHDPLPASVSRPR